jgi:thymidylate kinase
MDQVNKRMSRDSQRRSPLLVSFSGIDGAGKSTQIANLCAFLGTSSLRVELITFWDDVATLKPIREGAGQKIFKGDKGVGSPEAPIERRDKNVRSPLMTIVRLGLYLLDAVSLRVKGRRALRSGADVVIFDRYIYDELANLNLDNPVMRVYLRSLMTLVPRPDVAFVLDADPEQARARKPEYPLDFLHINRNAYLRLSRFLDGISVIPPMPIAQAKLSVVRRVLSQLPAREPVPSTMPVAAGSMSAPQPALQNELDGQIARPIAS